MDTPEDAGHLRSVPSPADDALSAPAGAERVTPPPLPWAALAIMTGAGLLAMSLWFSASAVAPTLIRVWHITGLTVNWLTASVQLGFVVGALTSATMGLPDLLNSRRLFVVSCVLGAVCNGLFILVGSALPVGLALRFLTGVAIAGVFPIAVKMISAWFARARGLAIGILIAGLTFGSAMPHLIRGLGGLEQWKTIMASSSLLAVLGGLLVWLFIADTHHLQFDTLEWGALRRIIRDRPVMLASGGYVGHMWELYAMWTWLPAFLVASWSPALPSTRLVAVSALTTFVVIGLAGEGGAVLGGWVADRCGRTLTTMSAMAVSGLCALLIGWTFQGPPWVTALFAIIWGVAIIADGAQFATSVTELSQPSIVGSAVTFQLAVGYLITVISINIIPWMQGAVGWRWAFAVLSVGPLLGILAMACLRRHPSAAQLAQGRR